MSFDIFQVDWILVDGVIIIVLVLLLVLVKILKLVTRWRDTLVNENLDEVTYEGELLFMRAEYIKINYWNYIVNIKQSEGATDAATLFLLRTKRRKRWVHAILEGLATFGFNVIDLKFTIIDKNFDNSIYKDLSNTILSIVNYMDLQGLQEDFMTISIYENPFQTLLINDNCRYQIQINPKLQPKDRNELKKRINSNKYHIFFSENIVRFIKNCNVCKIDSIKSSNITIINETNRNFKYCETILLGALIELINNN